MTVVVSVEDTGVCRKQVTVEVPPEEVAAATRRVVDQYARSVRIPGFRRGKVPAELVRRRYREDIERDVVERLVPDFWERARAEQGLDPLGQPELQEVGDLAEGQPLRFVAVVEVRPEVALGDLEFELPEVAVEPTAEEVDAALEDLRRQAGEWVVVDRPAARGDLAALRIHEDGATAAADPAEPPGPGESPDPAGAATSAAAATGQEVEIEVGDPRVWEELSLAVTGLAAGQTGRFSRRPDEGSEAAPRHFRVEIEAVKERELAPLDAELARKVGDFADLEALREAVVARLRHGKEHERDQKRREALLEQLRERHPLALPRGAVDAEVQRMANDFAHDLAHRGIDPGETQVDWQRLAAELRGPAERRVHERLLLDAAAERLGIEVRQDEVTGTLGGIARAQKTTVEKVREALGGTAGLAARLRRDHAVRRLLGEDPPGAEPNPEEATAGATGAAVPSPER
jgi:trigger factor